MEKKRKAEDKRNRRIERKFADPVAPPASPFDQFADDADGGDVVAESTEEKTDESDQ